MVAPQVGRVALFGGRGGGGNHDDAPRSFGGFLVDVYSYPHPLDDADQTAAAEEPPQAHATETKGLSR